jgi:hypothetical protein
VRELRLWESCHGQWHVSEVLKEQGGDVGFQGLTEYAIPSGASELLALSDWRGERRVHGSDITRQRVENRELLAEEEGVKPQSAGVKTEAWQVHMMLPKTVFPAITEAVP